MKHIKLFNDISEYEAFLNGGELIKPNVSYIVNKKHVKYHARPSETFEVTDGIFCTTDGEFRVIIK